LRSRGKRGKKPKLWSPKKIPEIKENAGNFEALLDDFSAFFCPRVKFPKKCLARAQKFLPLAEKHWLSTT